MKIGKLTRISCIIITSFFVSGLSKAQDYQTGGHATGSTLSEIEFFRQLGITNLNSSNLSSLDLSSKFLSLSLLDNCNHVEFGNQPAYFTVTIPLNEKFFPINGKARWLPPKPTANITTTIQGIDKDGDCVRDDIEHYIAKMYPKKSDQSTRKYLFEYARWLGEFLRISTWSVSTSQSIVTNQYKAAECFKRRVNDIEESTQILNKIFAQFHNTKSRSFRYIRNNTKLGGWSTREKISLNC